jgi:uncharacterized membrane protein YqjE
LVAVDDTGSMGTGDPRAPAPGGLVNAVRGLADSLLASARQRLELFALELHQEKFRAIQIFIWVSGAVFSAVMALTFLSLTVVYLFWETARLAVLGGLALFYTAGFVAILLTFRRYLARQPRPFNATLAELQNDRACTRPEN